MSQVKYRAACDHCSNTKTKCPQERPQCGRCRALGRDCHYSISLRHGKRPGNASLTQNKKSRQESVPGPEPIAAPIVDNNALPARSDSVWNSVSSTAYPTPTSIAPSLTINPNPNPLFDMSGSDGTATSTPSPILGSTWPFDAQSINLLGDLPTHPFIDSASPSDTYSSHESDTRPSCERIAPNLEFGSFDGLMGLHPERGSQDQCVRIATETLNSLYEIAQPHASGRNHRQHPTADQVLSTAGKALQNIIALLTCSCTKDFYLPIIIAMVASKILAWYQAVVFVRDPYTETPDGRRCTKELVADRPLTLGAYQLDDEVEWTLKNQLVLGQLHKMNEIVGRYHASFCGVGFGAQVAEGGRLYDSTSGFLRARLLYTIQEIEGRLQAVAA